MTEQTTCYKWWKCKWIYVCKCMYVNVWSSRSADWASTGMVANHARGAPRLRLRIWPRKASTVVSSRVGPFILHTQAQSGAYSYSRTPLLPPALRDGAHLYRQPPSSQSRDYQVTYRWRTPRVRRHKASIILKVVHLIGAADSGFTRGPLICTLSFLAPTYYNGQVV